MIVDFCIAMAIFSLVVWVRSDRIKARLFGLVPANPSEKFVYWFLDIQIWFALFFAFCAMIAVL